MIGKRGRAFIYRCRRRASNYSDAKAGREEAKGGSKYQLRQETNMVKMRANRQGISRRKMVKV
jgi:hypothetical protein